MEVLSNALAIITSTSVVPYVLPSLKKPSDNSDWIEKSESFLTTIIESEQQQPQDEEEEDDDVVVNLSDLAFNLGTLQYLQSSPSSNNNNWLEFAEENCCLDDDDDDLQPIETNIIWCNHFWNNVDDDDDITYNDIIDNNNSNDKSKSKKSSLSPNAAVIDFNQSLLDGKSVPTKPHPKWNILQVRMYWYNRAVSQYNAGKMVECQESCQSLKKTLLGGGDNSSSVGGGKKKNKQSAASSSSSSTAADYLWWDTRADVLITYAQQQKQQQQDSSSSTTKGGNNNSKGNSIAKLQERLDLLQKLKPSSLILDHAIAHVQLNLYQLQQQQQTSNNNSKQIRKVLKSLPESIQKCAAVEATFNSIGGRDEPEEEANDSKATSKNKSPEDQALALFGQGKYIESAELYSKTLPSPSKSNEDQLAHHLWYVQALSRCGQHAESDKLWKEIQPLLEGNIDEGSVVDGESLEQKALPRSSTSTSNNAKNIIGTATTGSSQKTKRRSKESVLRQRAKRREAYLKQLEGKGEYNPDRPTKPDPERWIPKHERSRGGRRGGGGRHQQQHRGAQGGGSQADAQRLDAAARRAGNYNPANTGPSTANMKAVGGGAGGGKRRGRR